jgi:hypothetical protein
VKLGDLVRAIRCQRCGYPLRWQELPRDGRPAACPGCWRDLAAHPAR